MLSKQALNQGITVFQTLFPNSYKTDNVQQIQLLKTTWYDALKHVDDETFLTAVKRVTTKATWFPSLKEVLNEIAIIENPILELNAEAEWANVITAIRKYGSWGISSALDNLNQYTQQIVRLLGGIARLCRADSKSLDYERKTFIALFNDKKVKYINNVSMSELLLTTKEVEERMEFNEYRKPQQYLIGADWEDDGYEDDYL